MKYLIIHHTAVSRSIQPAQFYVVNRYHKEKFKMQSRTGYWHAYTHFMGVNGVITQTRFLDEEGCHTRKYNKSGHIAICIAGDFNQELPTDKQMESLKKFLAKYPNYIPIFHRDLQENRDCPGKLFTKEMVSDLHKFGRTKKTDYLKELSINLLTMKNMKMYSLKKGIVKGLVGIIVFGIPMLITDFPILADLTLGAVGLMIVNYLKVKFLST